MVARAPETTKDDAHGAPGEAARYRVEDGRTCIDLRVREVGQLFDNRDPMPFLERDLDDEVALYLTECAGDLGRHEPIRVVLWVEHSALAEAEVARAFRKHFEYELERARRNVRAAMRTARNGLLVGLAVMLVLLGTSEVLVMRLSPGDARRILHDGLVIVSWVALWRPIELVLFDLSPARERRRLLERLRDAEVVLRVGASAQERPAG